MTEQPLQTICLDSRVVMRFKDNAIVRYLLDNGGIDLNQIARIPFPIEDMRQFARLIEYSVGRYTDLSYVEGHEHHAEAANARAARAAEAARQAREDASMEEWRSRNKQRGDWL